MTIYRHAVVRGYVELAKIADELGVDQAKAAEACRELRRLRLIVEEKPGFATPVDPESARQLSNEPLVDEIRARESLIESNNRELRRISDLLAQACPTGDPMVGILVVSDPAMVRQHIDRAILSCTQELVTTRPGGPRWDDEVVASLPADLLMLKRGVARRMLYQHTARANLGMRSWARRVAEHGGELRTTSEALEHMLIFDQRVAIIPVEPPDAEPSGSVVITHRPVVRFLHRTFQRLWSAAMAFESDDVQYGDVSLDIKTAVLRLMAAGLKDDAIAHRLGMATRTCRRHISAIMEDLHAASRFQAGVKAAQLGILSAADGPAAAGAGAESDSYPWW